MLCFNNYYWDESVIEEIRITFESTSILIHHEYTDCDMLVECKNCIRIDPIDIFEDMIIESLTIKELPADNSISNDELQVKKELQIHMVSDYTYHFYAEDIILNLVNE